MREHDDFDDLGTNKKTKKKKSGLGRQYLVSTNGRLDKLASCLLKPEEVDILGSAVFRARPVRTIIKAMPEMLSRVCPLC